MSTLPKASDISFGKFATNQAASLATKSLSTNVAFFI